jgi:hypothetical protein
MPDVSTDRLREILAGCEGVQGGPWKLDKFACYIWAPSEKGGDFPIMDEVAEKGNVARLRGWGYYTGNGHGALGLSPAEGEGRQPRCQPRPPDRLQHHHRTAFPP